MNCHSIAKLSLEYGIKKNDYIKAGTTNRVITKGDVYLIQKVSSDGSVVKLKKRSNINEDPILYYTLAEVWVLPSVPLNLISKLYKKNDSQITVK